MLSPLSSSLNPLGVGKARAPATWAAYVAALSPLWWGKFNEASGALIDYGSAGVNGSLVGSPTQGVIGQLGASEAYSFNGNNRIDIAYSAAWADQVVFESVMLIKPDAGGNSANRYLGRDVGYILNRNRDSTLLTGIVRNSATTQFTTNASNQGLTNGTWVIASIAYNDNTDRLVHLYVNGVECSYSAQPALTGTLQYPTSGMTIANNQALGVDSVIDVDEVFFLDYNLNSTQRLSLVQLAGL